MSIKDVIKSSVYESFGNGTGLSLYQILMILFVACIIGAYVFFVYKAFSRSEFYSKDLNITIACMTIVVAAIMVAMQSNLLVSLGMVGALSIVRFRTAVKNPMDLLYLFWGISSGIICGVGLYALAIFLCVVMTLAIWIFGRIPAAHAPGLIVIRCGANTELATIEETLKANSKYFALKSTHVTGESQEAIYEIISKNTAAMISAVNSLETVTGVNYVEHNGEMRG